MRGELRFSFVQTRGSVPVYWAEINNLRYKPDLKILDLSSTVRARAPLLSFERAARHPEQAADRRCLRQAESLNRHFEQQISLYGDQYLVNLVNSHGYEKPVKEAYERALDAMANPRVHYTYFDFHKECKGLRFDRVGVLIDGLHEELEQQGYVRRILFFVPASQSQRAAADARVARRYSYFFHDTTQSPSQPQRKQTSVVRTNCMDWRVSLPLAPSDFSS